MPLPGESDRPSLCQPGLTRTSPSSPKLKPASTTASSQRVVSAIERPCVLDARAATASSLLLRRGIGSATSGARRSQAAWYDGEWSRDLTWKFDTVQHQYDAEMSNVRAQLGHHPHGAAYGMAWLTGTQFGKQRVPCFVIEPTEPRFGPEVRRFCADLLRTIWNDGLVSHPQTIRIEAVPKLPDGRVDDAELRRRATNRPGLGL
jgi:hypothetical protein